MDIVSIIGIILGLITLIGGMILKGAPPVALLNPAALVIIFVGTAAAIMISFPKERLKVLPALFKVIFFEQKLMTKQVLLGQFLTLSTQARKEGLLSLEAALEEVDNAFMKRGVMMVIDGQPSEYVEDVMTRDLENMTERHHANANIFTQAGTYAPTLGVLGAVVGLVAALSDLSDIEKLGH
ncbi:MAG TPA: flagellar motor protein MotA, partial [Exiguobacterium sp.]|nr:flagellar motor protein MotA [Exiguobacterium sp.]